MSRNQSHRTRIMIRPGTMLAIALALVWTTAAHAQPGAPIEWVQTSLTEPSGRLYTPSSGALFVRTAIGLSRSDDGGTIWSAVTLPPETPVPTWGLGWPGSIEVDPTNHTTIYATSPNGVYKTDDDAQSWRVILPPDPAFPDLGQIAVSPADNRLVYVTLTNRGSNQLRLLRSSDGGSTWETVHGREVSVHVSCDWVVHLLQAHRTDPNRVFIATTCPRTSSFADVEQSLDRGATWTMFRTSSLSIPGRVLVVGDSAPGVILLPVNKDSRGGGSLLARSHDDGATWTTLLEFSGGGGASGGGPNVGIGAVAVDPTAPDRLVIALNASMTGERLDSQIRLSTDSGTTWTEIGPPDFPRTSDLAYGIDGRTIYASTASGVWRATAP